MVTLEHPPSKDTISTPGAAIVDENATTKPATDLEKGEADGTIPSSDKMRLYIYHLKQCL
jgi:hypothetical protein